MSPNWFAGNAGVIIAAALFLLTSLILAGTLVRMQEHSAKSQATQTALRETVELQESLNEASAAARGFALSRDRTLLAVYKVAKQFIGTHLGNLVLDLKDDTGALRHLRESEPRIAAQIQDLDAVIGGSDEPGATDHASEARRIEVGQSNNAQLAALRAHLRDALQSDQGQTTGDLRLAIALVLIAGIAAPLCGLIGIYLLRRERDNQRARELQMELMHTQRLAIMGETSAMLAHEINQPLAAATNYISVLRRLLDTGAVEKAQPVVERINEQVQRTGTILRKLRRFIEKRESERTLESPEVLVDDAITLLGTIDNEVGLDTRIGADLPRVMVDRVQLQQVLVNLMRNAIEAMQECSRRDLVLSVISPDHKSVEISLADTGPGLPQHVSERLFQPFVSTKQSGMGLGLSIRRSIIEQHNVRIW